MGKKLSTAVLLGLTALALPRVALAQITSIYNSNGFESPGIVINSPPRLAGYSATGLPGLPGAGSQQGWYTTDQRQLTFPFNRQAGSIQSAIVQSGSQAFRVQGSELVNDIVFSGGTFWWKYPDAPPFTGNVFNPIANGTPVVVAETGFRRANTALPLTDIPLAGFYFEGFRAISGNQYMITQVSVDSLGTIRAITVGGADVASAPGIVANNTWVDLRVELDFTLQEFSVYLNNTIVPFAGTFTSLPFRDTNIGEGAFNRLREHGYNAFHPGGATVTGDVYFDNYNIFARSSAVPEPTTWAFFGLVAGGVSFWRCRRKVQKELDDFEKEHRNDPEVVEELNTP